MNRPLRSHLSMTYLISATVLAGVLVGVPGGPLPAAMATQGPEDDIIQPIPYVPSGSPETLTLQGALTIDPLNLVLYPDELRRYSLGTDVFEVWECPDAGLVPMTASAFVIDAETRMTAYFSWLSNGRYDPDFVVGGVVPAGQDCRSWARTNATGTANAALFIRNAGGGLAGPGYTCAGTIWTCPTTYPDNVREGFIGVAGTSWKTVLAHEMGHMLSWPHSKSGVSGSDYDNAIDLMSGNYGTWSSGGGTARGTYPDPYGTVAISRYGAGWYDPADVTVWDGTTGEITLNAISGGGMEALVIDGGSSYFVLGVRVSSSMDPFPSVWTGIEVYEVTRCPSCWGLNGVISQEPPVPFDWSKSAAYAQPLPHVLGFGSTITLGNVDVSVTGKAGSTFTLSVVSKTPPVGEPPPVSPPTATFLDVPSNHAFHAEVEWMAAEGITAGCNPPTNDRFCPDDYITRAQMAAFLVRALGYATGRYSDLFIDDDASIFEREIDLLGTAGVTRGCNPPANDRFCPDDYVTRSQMAAFLYRALG